MIYDSTQTDTFLGTRNQFVRPWNGRVITLWAPAAEPGGSEYSTVIVLSAHRSGPSDREVRR